MLKSLAAAAISSTTAPALALDEEFYRLCAGTVAIYESLVDGSPNLNNFDNVLGPQGSILDEGSIEDAIDEVVDQVLIQCYE